MLAITIKFDWSMLIGFFCGVVTGFIILFLIYLLYVLINIKKDKKIIKSEKNIETSEIIKRIDLTKKAFKEKKTKGSKSISYTYDLCAKLVIDTASDFFPNSKHPLFELSIDEMVLLIEYIRKRIDEVLDYKGISFLRKIKVSTLLSMADTKKILEENEIIKATKRYKLKSTYEAAKKVINLINPLWWAKKLVIDGTFNILINKMCLVVIGIVGEETYNIYSKKVFLNDEKIDVTTNEINEISKEDFLNEE